VITIIKTISYRIASKCRLTDIYRVTTALKAEN
jgi:hypothetical protein